jgi:hypothetical protein
MNNGHAPLTHLTLVVRVYRRVGGDAGGGDAGGVMTWLFPMASPVTVPELPFPSTMPLDRAPRLPFPNALPLVLVPELPLPARMPLVRAP